MSDRIRDVAIHDVAPAGRWEDAYPVGNGRHGALAYGDPWNETVIVTHHALAWPDTDGPPAGATPPDLSDRLDEVRDLLLAGQSARALARFTDGWPEYHPRPFHPAFAVRLRSAGQPSAGQRSAGELSAGEAAADLPGGYLRTLDYRAGVAAAAWRERADGGTWRRACFASRARDVIVARLAAPRGGLLDVTIEIDVLLPGAPPGLRVSDQVRPTADGDVTVLTGVEYPGGGRGGYAGATRVIAHGARPAGGGVRVTGGRELTLMTRVVAFGATGDRDTGLDSALNSVLDSALDTALAAVRQLPASYRELLAEHSRLHAAAYGKVRLDLRAPKEQRSLPTSELLTRQAAEPGRPLPALLERLFDSGRYLLLAASGALPPRLTGLWQGDWHPAWSGAITTNANLNLQLAGAVTTDVPAAIGALADLVRDQLPDWRVNARRLFGTRGIVAPAHSDGLGGLAYHFAPGYPLHAWTAGADWLLVPLLDAVAATGDQRLLRERVAPALRELATFYEDFLTRTDSDGRLTFVPSYSPENAPVGWSPVAVNATMDIAAARHALLAAAAAPGTSDHAARRWRALSARLPPYRINADGALAEWAWPPAGSGQPPLADRYEHRHVSHLYPVWPLHEITVADTPELAAAALAALRRRRPQDDSAHGYLHRALVAARLRDAVLAGRGLAALTGNDFFFRSLMSSHYPGRRVYNADAACALPGVLTEMLVDSVPGRIDLLPAVPDFMPAGRLAGARTLTRVLVAELRWNLPAGHVTVVLVSQTDQEITLACHRAPPRLRVRRVRLPAAAPVRIDVTDQETTDARRLCEALRLSACL